MSKGLWFKEGGGGGVRQWGGGGGERVLYKIVAEVLVMCVSSRSVHCMVICLRSLANNKFLSSICHIEMNVHRNPSR